MSVKQDRSAARTAADIERKYSFGKKFSEILGLIDESRDKVDSVESTLRGEITETQTTLQRNSEEIAATATSLTEAKNEINGINGSVTEISKKVELKMDASAVNIAIEQRMASGVDQVVTATGFRFDNNGLNISKTGEEMESLIDNTGMYVKRSGETVLSANNNGVDAVNLHAKTYLIIGADNGRSRIEDYGEDRTGVYWIG